MLKTGDPCPCCGQPIKTDDPFLLQILTDIADHRKDHRHQNLVTIPRAQLGRRIV